MAGRKQIASNESACADCSGIAGMVAAVLAGNARFAGIPGEHKLLTQ
jgi:hypothetical protein